MVEFTEKSINLRRFRIGIAARDTLTTRLGVRGPLDDHSRSLINNGEKLSSRFLDLEEIPFLHTGSGVRRIF